MPRRRSRRLLVTGIRTPTDVAKDVIQGYVGGAQTKLGDWAKNYRSSISSYVKDAKKQDLAREALGTWYDVYITEIYPKIKEAYATGRTAYITRKAGIRVGA